VARREGQRRNMGDPPRRRNANLRPLQGGRTEAGVGGARSTGEAGESRGREGALVPGASKGRRIEGLA
jgi:hypothetical protein